MPDQTDPFADPGAAFCNGAADPAPAIHALRSLDCAHKVRIRYRIPGGISARLLHGLDLGPVVVREFSKRVPGAQDLCSLNCVQLPLRLAGAVGEPWLVATFGKLGESVAPPGIELLESRLAGWTGYSIVQHGMPKDGQG